jgi:MPBQ/MSBQ methyltransferase
MRLIQHKKEAYWFYWYLSQFYDKFVNPLFWTPRMRDESLELAQLDNPSLRVVDVGSGTGFTTAGIVKKVSASQVTCVDQSPHQMAKAKQKPDLQACTFQLGDAEHLPCPTDAFDRYVSAGSIEYWPDPQRGIAEAYRVIKPGGTALLIGPLEPQHTVGRWVADTWMLFPKESEYLDWFRKAGFSDIRVRYIRPFWFTGKAEYGLAISGRKTVAGESPAAQISATPPAQEGPLSFGRRLQLIGRVTAGSAVAFLFIPAALWGYLKQALRGERQNVAPEYRESLNVYQIVALLAIIAAIAGLVYRLF